jgi:hypothetical protein
LLLGCLAVAVGDDPYVQLALPEAALAWVSAQLGGAPITSTHVLSGGISHANVA